jgi:membrane AbrB-like protein
MFIGLRFSHHAGRELKRIFDVALFAGLWWLGFPFGLGWIVNRWFHLGLPTSILGTVPGGVAEMSMLALSLDADAALVALMQFFRLSSALIAIPIISKRIERSMPEPREIPLLHEACSTKKPFLFKRLTFDYAKEVYALILATIGGVLFDAIGVPVGGFVGSLTFTAIATILGFPVRMPPLILRQVGQMGLGTTIGLYATPGTLSILAKMFFTILGTTTAMLGWGIILAFIVKSRTHWNLITCLLATCPGGLTQLASISEDLGADPIKVSLLHLIRLLTVFVILPPLIKLLI